MAQEDDSGQVGHDRFGGDAHEVTHRSPYHLRVVRYDEVSLQLLPRLLSGFVVGIVEGLFSYPFGPWLSIAVLGLTEVRMPL
jgi:hypothetical protein